MIERLYIHNFRCLENFALDLASRSSAVLIGKNGAGKTTVLHALGVLQAICRGSSRVKDIIHAKDFTRYEKDRPMWFEIDVVLGQHHFNYSVSFEWPANFYEARILEEKLKKDGADVFTRHQRQVRLGSGPEFGLDWHVFALPVINEHPSEHSIKDVKEFLANMILVAPIPPLMEGFSEEPATELQRYAGNYASCLRDLLQKKPRAYEEFAAFIKNVFPDFASIENADRGKDGGSQLIVTFEQPTPHQSLSLDFDVLSDGEKSIFVAAYIAALSSVRSPTDPPVVCIWDEPDAHLALSEVGNFIKIMRKNARLGGQFIATTHHPETISKFSDDNTFVLSRKSHLEPTVIKLLNAYGYTGDLIHALVRDEIIG